jgi:hypothetical protein
MATTKLRFKDRVSLRELRPQMVLAMTVLLQIYEANFAAEMVITSVNDGDHAEESYHYEGRAFDARTKGTGRSTQIAQQAAEILRPLGFDVVLEDLKGENEHLHVELDRRAGY